MVKFAFTVDVERDISKYIREGYFGVEEGLPPVLDILEELDVVGDFFVTADVCQRYPDIIKRMVSEGHNLGCHGLDHTLEYYCKKSYDVQYEDIAKATKIMEEATGLRPRMFRAPNFSVGGNTLKALIDLKYDIDSSVLPGRFVRKWKLLTLLDQRGAPTEVYHPSRDNPARPGKLPIVEVPITANPDQTRSPLGYGYLNYYGLEKTISAVNKLEDDSFFVFLSHPWEMANMGKKYDTLPDWVKPICSGDTDRVRRFLIHMKEKHEMTSVNDIAKEFMAQSDTDSPKGS